MANPRTEPAQQSLEAACRTIFGVHPEDVIAPIEFSCAALMQIEQILTVIVETARAADHRSAGRIKLLAEAAGYIASDISNTAGCCFEDYRDKMRAALAAEVRA